MPDTLTRTGRTATGLTVLVWFVLLSLLLGPQLIGKGMPPPSITVSLSTTLLLIALASVLLYRLAGRITRYAPMFVAVVLIAALVAAIDTAKFMAITALMEGAVEKRNWIAYGIGAFTFFMQGLGLSAAFYLILRGGAELRRREAELARAESRAAAAELAAAHAETAASNARLATLRYQLNPHFLFNTLNAISSMVVTGRGEVAEGMLARLSQFLRTTLAGQPDAMVTLEAELESVANYLEIEAFRLRDRLQFDVDCAPDTLDLLLPGFLLQPLVENAIKHGVTPVSRPVTVRVVARRDAGDRLHMSIADDGAGGSGERAPSGFGVGLANVRERLAAQYGADATVETRVDAPGFVVTLTLPARAETDGVRAAVAAR